MRPINTYSNPIHSTATNIAINIPIVNTIAKDSKYRLPSDLNIYPRPYHTQDKYASLRPMKRESRLSEKVLCQESHNTSMYAVGEDFKVRGRETPQLGKTRNMPQMVEMGVV